MKRTFRLFSVLVLAVSVLCLTSCGTQNSGASKEDAAKTEAVKAAEKKDKLIIGATFGNIGDVFDRTLYDGMLRYVDENSDKVELQMLNANGDTALQLSQAEQIMNAGVDALIVWPVDAEGTTPIIEMANSKNIPVLCVNAKAAGGKFVYVGSDDVESGRIQGEWLAENLPENATYCYFMGPIGHTAQIGRKQGIEEVLKEKRPDVKMLAEMSGEWDRAKAMSIADDWLKAYPDADAFVSQNDNMALGIIESLRTANKLDDIIVTGIDATSEACGSIKNGELAMSVFQNADAQGYNSVDVAYKMALGEWDGSDFTIPYEIVEPSNVDKYIAAYEAAEAK